MAPGVHGCGEISIPVISMYGRNLITTDNARRSQVAVYPIEVLTVKVGVKKRL